MSTAIIQLLLSRSGSQRAGQQDQQETQLSPEKKIPLEELQIHEVGMQLPSAKQKAFTDSLREYQKVNEVIKNNTFFCAVLIFLRPGLASYLDLQTQCYDYADVLIQSRNRKDKIGLDINKVNPDGTNACKLLISLMSTSTFEPSYLSNLLQKLVDAGVNLSSDENQAALVLQSQQLLPSEVSEIQTTLFQTPLDFAFQLCPPALSVLNTNWTGHPTEPPRISPAIKILLKGIYSKVKNDSLLSIPAFKLALGKLLSTKERSFPTPLVGIIAEYYGENRFHFTCRVDDIDKFLRLGRLFYEYDKAVDSKNRGEKALQAKQEDIDSILDDSMPENSSIKARAQHFQEQTADQFRSVETQLTAIRTAQAGLKQEFAGLKQEVVAQTKSFTEQFRQTTGALQKLAEMTQSMQTMMASALTQTRNPNGGNASLSGST